jgi:hypothetical protein
VLSPRTQPVVLRLASGEILVAGGKDTNGKPVGLLEILSPDAKKAASINFIARPIAGFAPLDAGGALIVVAPETTDPPTFANVWRLTGDGALLALPRWNEPLSDLKVFPSSGGGAIVWTGTDWFRFEPWTETFGNPLARSPGPALAAPSITPEFGLPIWLSTEAGALRVNGRRFSIRNQFATEILPLATRDRGPLAPDRSPVIAGMSFDPSSGLSLPEGTQVFVADGRYADFVLDVNVVAGNPPVIVLRDASGARYEIGGADCPLVPSPTVHVERIGAAIGVGAPGDLRVCTKPIPFDRAAIGFRGQGTTLQNVRLRRTVN